MKFFARKKQNAEPSAVMNYPTNEESNEERVSIPREKFILETRTTDDLSELPIYGIYQRF